MWIFGKTLYKQVNYIRKSREKFESRNININTRLERYHNVFPEVLANGSGTTTKTDSKRYKFSFKNLVLSGAGATAVAHCGVAKALEEHGILKDIRRFAGTEEGAIVAALLSFGFNSFDVEKIMSINWNDLYKDTTSLSFAHAIFNQFGHRPVEKFKKFMGDVLAIKKNNPDITFQEAYEKFGKELCIVVTNVNTMSEEYCHVRTTPKMPIRDALCMSISLPVRNRAISYKQSLYVSGGLLCMYPIHCFDGWYLSMKRNMPLEMYKDPFQSKKTNLETLGCLVYSENQYHLFRGLLERQCNVSPGKLPETQLKREWKSMTESQKIGSFTELREEVKNNFLNIFKSGDSGSQAKEEFSFEEFEYILTKACVEEAGTENSTYRDARTYAEMIYGPNVNARMIFEEIKKNDKNKVTLTAIEEFVSATSECLRLKYRDVEIKRHEIRGGLFHFLTTIIRHLKKATMMNYFKEDDVARTVGINTWYINASDYQMEPEDITFLINQGKRSTEKFLEHFGYENNLPIGNKIPEKPENLSLTKQDLLKLKPRYYDTGDIISFILEVASLYGARHLFLILFKGIFDFNVYTWFGIGNPENTAVSLFALVLRLFNGLFY